MTAVPSGDDGVNEDNEETVTSQPTERSRLVQRPEQSAVAPPSENSARFAGILGFSTGSGALLAGEIIVLSINNILFDATLYLSFDSLLLPPTPDSNLFNVPTF